MHAIALYKLNFFLRVRIDGPSHVCADQWESVDHWWSAFMSQLLAIGHLVPSSPAQHGIGNSVQAYQVFGVPRVHGMHGELSIVTPSWEI